MQALLDQITGHVTVIWDGAPIHRSRVIKAFLAAGAAKRLHLELLPGYAPDLNPDEGVWNYLKRVELANVCCHDVDELTGHVQQAAQRLRAMPDILRACSRQCGYSVKFLTTTSVDASVNSVNVSGKCLNGIIRAGPRPISALPSTYQRIRKSLPM